MTARKLPRSFYLRPTLTVARDILGKHIVKKNGKHTLIGKIVEVEAYLGSKDPASHAYRGRTSRNEVMFGKGGNLYVYFTYGMHFCANVVTEEEGLAHAVLIRGVEPIEGIDLMRKNRGITRRTLDHGDERNLTNGPAKFCQAFDITRKHNGTDLLGVSIYLAPGEGIPASHIIITKRIGITRAIDRPWRFFIKNNPWVSR